MTVKFITINIHLNIQESSIKFNKVRTSNQNTKILILEVSDSWTRSIDKKDEKVYIKVHDESFLRYDKVQDSDTKSNLISKLLGKLS